MANRFAVCDVAGVNTLRPTVVMLFAASELFAVGVGDTVAVNPDSAVIRKFFELFAAVERFVKRMTSPTRYPAPAQLDCAAAVATNVEPDTVMSANVVGHVAVTAALQEPRCTAAMKSWYVFGDSSPLILPVTRLPPCAR